MAQRVRTSYVSDLSGQEIPEDQVHTVNFGWGRSLYEIDLTPEEAAELDQLMRRYVDHARQAGGPRRSDRQGQQQLSSGRTTDQLATIRTWARQNGYTLADRGRVARHIIDAYDHAHPST